MKRKKGIQLHNRKIVPEQDECGDVDNMAGCVPEVRKELSGTCCKEPDQVREDDIPPGQMVPTILDGNGAFPNKITNKARSYKKSQGVKELVDLQIKIDEK